MDCPICRKKELSPLQPQCTDCGTAMKVVLMLNDQNQKILDMAKQRVTLEGELALMRKNSDLDSGHRRGQVFKVLSLLMIFPLFLWIFHKPSTGTADKNLILKMQSTTDSLLQLKNTQITDYQQIAAQNEQSLAAQKVKAIYYVLKKDDTLAELGELFYNNKTAGFRIAKDNQLSVDDYKILPTGKRIKIVFR